MRKYWALLVISIVAATLAVGAIACGGDDKKDGGDQPTATQGADTPEPTSADQTPEATDSGTPSAEAIEVEMVADPTFDVTGTATLAAAAGGGSEVTMTIDGGLEPGSHLNHIHGGTCAARGDVEETLTALEADADGAAGPTSTTLADDAEHFQDGQHYFAVHAIDGTVVACGDIPAAG